MKVQRPGLKKLFDIDLSKCITSDMYIWSSVILYLAS